jgi:hypothetical protein
MIGHSELVWRAHEAAIEPTDLDTGTFLESANSDLTRLGYSPVQPSDLQNQTRMQYRRIAELPAKPTGSLEIDQQPWLYPETPYADIPDKRIIAIGSNVGSLVCSYMVLRGYNPKQMLIIDPAGRRGGIWNSGLADKFNNPKPLRFPGGHRLTLDDRDGQNMAGFLNGIADDYLGDTIFMRDTAASIQPSGGSESNWMVHTNSGSRLEADTVIISTGTAIPRKIDGDRLKSNLEEAAQYTTNLHLSLERSQRKLRDWELESGRPIVLMGLGNSTGTMLRQIREYEIRTGREVNYIITTDASRDAVMNPHVSYFGKNPIHRNVAKGYLTGYSADIPEDLEAFNHARAAGKIVSGVQSIYFDDRTAKLTITSSEGKVKPIEEPRVFALLGYERDRTLFGKAGSLLVRGVVNKRLHGPFIRGSDGAVWTKNRDYNSDLYAFGAVAASQDNPNAAVIPGVFGVLPGFTLTEAVRDVAKQQRRPGLREHLFALSGK